MCHAGYRHAVFVATLSEANRLRPDWNLGDEATPELDTYRCNFIDFANFFADDMFGSEFVHRRIKTREIFDLANGAYVDMRRAAHRAKAAADAAASSDSDDDDGDDDSPPAMTQRQPTSSATSNASDLDDGTGRPGAASCVATPTHGRPPDTSTAAADAAAVLVSAPARALRTVAEHEPASSAPTERQLAFGATSSANELTDGAGRPGAASCVAAPAHGRPPDTAATAADAAAALVSASARVPRAAAEHEQSSSALTSYHSGSESPRRSRLLLSPPRGLLRQRETPAPTGGTFAQRAAIPVWCQHAAREGTRGAVVRTRNREAARNRRRMRLRPTENSSVRLLQRLRLSRT